MLVLNERLDKLEGVLKLSDCEYEFVVRWLSGSSQASFFIGDKDEERLNVQKFINGNQYCYIDLDSFLSYLKTVEHIVKKYKSMYYGPFNHLTDIHNRFSNMAQEDAKIVLSYEYPERYIRILNNKRNFRENALVFGEGPLNNGDDFRHSYIGGITNITIQKNESGQYWLRIELVDNWRDVIMEANGKKVTLESLISIFNIEMENNIDEGMSEVQSGQVFGIKYAPLLDNNSHKFSYKDIVSGSNYNSQDVLTAVELGISISSAVIWSPDLSIKSNAVDEENVQNYGKFKKLLAWFTNQLNVNNGLIEGTKTSGQGYKEGSSIRKYYKDWREYSDFTLDCNLISGYQSTFSKVNYINKTDTGINIRPKFDAKTKEIKYLYIDVYDMKKEYGEDVSAIFEKEYELAKLGLADEHEPNDLLKELFDDFSKFVESLTEKLIDAKYYDECERLSGGENIILYGVPGAGKSWTIKTEYCNENNRMERLVFHPDYTYSDFVGQILPRLDDDGTVSYEFCPGPFTKLLRKAYTNPNDMFYLVVEEVNRGNAPAIFGDIFQLLDRNQDGSSEYEITNSDIAKIVYSNENHKVSIPSNMSILCTMNTSDQNVFTLDTAFQRRWSMRLIKNKFKEGIESELANAKILDTSVTWEKFFTEINNIILQKNIRMTSSEDKRLGTHFVSIEDLNYDQGNEKQNNRFPEKVLKYLWDDAFKFTKEDIFDLDNLKSLEDVIEHFVIEQGDNRFKIFKEKIFSTLVSK